MIYVQIRPWLNQAVLPQISTFWEISTKEDMSDIVETSRTQGDKLYYYQSELIVPSGETFWVRVTREFLDSLANETMDPIPITGVDTIINNNIIHREDLYIEPPFLYVNEEEFYSVDFVDFEVRTSKFRCKQDGHVATNWIITDSEGTILYKSLYDQYDKTSKRIEKTNDILNKSIFKIYVSHISTNGMESETSCYTFNNNNFNFDVTGLFENITPYQDLNLYITPTGARDKYIDSVWLKVPNDNNQITKGINITPNLGDGTIVIPGDELTYDKTLYLDIYAFNSNEEYSSKRYVLKTRKSTFNNSFLDVEYDKKVFNYDPANTQTLTNLPTGFVTSEMVNGKILLPKRGSGSNPFIYRAIYMSTQDGPKIEIDFNSNNTQGDVSISSNSVDNCFLKMYNNNLLVIDSYGISSGVPVPSFSVFRYDPVQDAYTKLFEKIRNDENMPIGLTNCITQISSTKLWYLVVGSGLIREYDFTTNVVQDVIDLGQDFTLGTMINNRRSGNIILFNNSGKTKILDVDTLRLRESIDVPFAEWVGKRLKPVELPNGDYAIFNVTEPTSANAVAYYDAVNNRYESIVPKAIPNVIHAGVITTTTKSVYYINKETTGNNRYIINRLY